MVFLLEICNTQILPVANFFQRFTFPLHAFSIFCLTMDDKRIFEVGLFGFGAIPNHNKNVTALIARSPDQFFQITTHSV